MPKRNKVIECSKSLSVVSGEDFEGERNGRYVDDDKVLTESSWPTMRLFSTKVLFLMAVISSEITKFDLSLQLLREQQTALFELPQDRVWRCFVFGALHIKCRRKSVSLCALARFVDERYAQRSAVESACVWIRKYPFPVQCTLTQGNVFVNNVTDFVCNTAQLRWIIRAMCEANLSKTTTLGFWKQKYSQCHTNPTV